jgi:hypothetical protein
MLKAMNPQTSMRQKYTRIIKAILHVVSGGLEMCPVIVKEGYM